MFKDKWKKEKVIADAIMSEADTKAEAEGIKTKEQLLDKFTPEGKVVAQLIADVMGPSILYGQKKIPRNVLTVLLASIGSKAVDDLAKLSGKPKKKAKDADKSDN